MQEAAHWPAPRHCCAGLSVPARNRKGPRRATAARAFRSRPRAAQAAFTALSGAMQEAEARAARRRARCSVEVPLRRAEALGDASAGCGGAGQRRIVGKLTPATRAVAAAAVRAFPPRLLAALLEAARDAGGRGPHRATTAATVNVRPGTQEAIEVLAIQTLVRCRRPRPAPRNHCCAGLL